MRPGTSPPLAPWNVQSPVPIVTISAPRESELVESPMTFQFQTDRPASDVLCKIDTDPDYTSCAQGLSVALATGFHAVQIHGIGLDGRVGGDAFRTFRVDAEHRIVDIDLADGCFVNVSPLEFTVPADQVLNLLFYNRSQRYPVAEITSPSGQTFDDLRPGGAWIDPTPHCTVKNTDETAFIFTTLCVGQLTQVRIHCRS